MRGVVVGAVVLAAALGAWLLQRPAERGGGPRLADRAPETPSAPPSPLLVGKEPDAGRSTAVEPVQTAGALVLRGRVVDDRRRPVAGARVEGAIDGRPPALATTDAEGRYEVSLGDRGRGVLFGSLRATEGPRLARAILYVTPEQSLPMSMWPLVLRATRSLEVLVEHAGAPVPRARVVVLDSDAQGSHARLGDVVADEKGRALVERIDVGRVRAFAGAPGVGRGTAETNLPREDALRIDLPPTRSLDVLVVRAPDEAPVAGAEVHVGGGMTSPWPGGTGCLPPLPDLRTDGAGRVRVTDLPAGHLSLVARAPGLALPSDGTTPMRVGVLPEATEAKVVLEPYRTLVFPVATEGAGPPPDGTALAVVSYQGNTRYAVIPRTAVVSGGEVQIDAFPPGHDRGHVLAPDGRWALWSSKPNSDRGDPIRFETSRAFTVHLVTADGKDLADQALWLSLQPRGQTEVVRTDAGGQARFGPLQGNRAILWWSAAGARTGARLLEFDLRAAPETLELVVQPLRVTLHVSVDGQARLPESYQLSLGRERVDRGWVDAAEIAEDPATGTLRFPWLRKASSEPLLVNLRAPGFPTVDVSLTPDAASNVEGPIELRRSSVVVATVHRPEDGRYWLMLQQWYPDLGEWFLVREHASNRGVEGVHRYEGLPPARYRVIDHQSQLASEPFEVGTDTGTLEVTLDLSSLLLLHGRVLVPEGESPAHAQVHVGDPPPPGGTAPDPIRVKADGTFAHRAVRGSLVRLRATHPALATADVTIVAGRDEAILRLERGTWVSFQLAGFDFTTSPPMEGILEVSLDGRTGPVEVRASKDRDALLRTSPVRLLVEKGRVRFALPEPGTWFLHVDLRGRVPQGIDGVAVAAGANDLGTVTLGEGSVLTLRLDAEKRPVPEWIHATADHLGEPAYQARGGPIEAGTPPVVRLTGLGPGRFRVVVRAPGATRPGGLMPTGPSGGGEIVLDRVVEVDGTSPLSIDVALP